MKKETLLVELAYQAAKTASNSITPGDVFNNMSAALRFLSDYTDSTLKALNVSRLKSGVSISTTFDVSSFDVSQEDIKLILIAMSLAGNVQNMQAVFDEEIVDDQFGTYSSLISSCRNNGWEILGLVINEPTEGFILNSSKLDEGVLT